MEKRRMEETKIQAFEAYLRDEEKSTATVEKYIRDVRCFAKFADESEISKQAVLEYKTKLGASYAVASANSMIAALNSFFRFCDWHDLCVKQFRIQRQVYCSEEKELSRGEYIRLLEAARKKKNERLNLIIQTLCGTGIRVSELVGINISDIDFSINGFLVTRKGGNQAILYFSAGSFIRSINSMVFDSKFLTIPSILATR